MAGFNVVLGCALAFLVFGAVQAKIGKQSVPECPPQESKPTPWFFPDPLNCSMYYMCSNGVPYHMPCPDGLQWDQSLETCNWPDIVKCSEEVIVEPCDPTEEDCEVTPKPPIIVPIKPGQPKNITVTFRLGHHPVDVYYLMDFSGSMDNDKESLINLSGELKGAVANMSKDHTLGFGVFVDKPRGPFGSGADYSFHNTYPLRTETADFVEKLSAVAIRHGGDTPESQLEGLYQSAVCHEVGWRQHSRHLILFATDAVYHQAGDGQQSNPKITTPFDGACHLNAAGYYTQDLLMDYPSVDQVVTGVTESQKTVIFAVTKDVKTTYESLSASIKPSAVGELARDSGNVVKLIVDEYNKIAKRVEMEESETSEEVVITYYTNCGGTVEETNVCEEIGDSGEVTFIIQFDLKNCPKDPKDWNQTVKVNPVGLPTYVLISLELLCSA